MRSFLCTTGFITLYLLPHLSEIGEGASPTSPWGQGRTGAANSSQDLAGQQGGSWPALLWICKSDFSSMLPGSYFRVFAMPRRHGTLWMWSACRGCAKVYERESDVWWVFFHNTSFFLTFPLLSLLKMSLGLLHWSKWLPLCKCWPPCWRHFKGKGDLIESFVSHLTP